MRGAAVKANVERSSNRQNGHPFYVNSFLFKMI